MSKKSWGDCLTFEATEMSPTGNKSYLFLATPFGTVMFVVPTGASKFEKIRTDIDLNAKLNLNQSMSDAMEWGKKHPFYKKFYISKKYKLALSSLRYDDFRNKHKDAFSEIERNQKANDSLQTVLGARENERLTTKLFIIENQGREAFLKQAALDPEWGMF